MDDVNTDICQYLHIGSLNFLKYQVCFHYQMNFDNLRFAKVFPSLEECKKIDFNVEKTLLNRLYYKIEDKILEFRTFQILFILLFLKIFLIIHKVI
jgi:hypothetical protein